MLPALAALAAFLLLALLPTAAGAEPLAFASRITDDSVSVIDLATGSVTATYPTGPQPSGLAVTADGAWLFVAESGAANLLAVELATGTTTAIPVGNGPSGVAADPVQSRVYVANTQDDTVTVVEVPSLAILGTVPVGDGPLAVAADGARVWVANFNGDSVSVMDAASLAVTATVPVGTMPAGIAALPGGGRAWVANLFDDTVSVIDAAGGPAVTATLPVAPSPRGVAVAPAGDRVYVAGFGDGTVTALDATTGAVLGTGDAGLNAADVRVTPAGDRLLVTDPAGSGVAVLDAATLQPLTPVPAGVGHLALAGFVTAAASVPEIPAVEPTGLLLLGVLLALSALLVLRLRRSRGAALLVALATVAGATLPAPPIAAQPAFQIDDGTLADGDWEVFQATTAGGTQAAIQSSPNGNPGDYRYMNHNHALSEVPAAIEVVHRYVGTGDLYDPAVAGAIASIDAAWDRRNGLEGLATVEEAFVVTQGGTAYRTALDSFTSTTWEGTSHPGLTAADFDDGSGANPDFSASGAPLRFGYLRRTVASIGFSDHHLDNFQVDVTAQSPPPPGDPGTLRFEQRAHVARSGGTYDIRVLRVGGSSGAVGVTVQLPLGPGNQSIALSWADGDSAPKTATLNLTALPADGPILTLKPILTAPTGGATLHPGLDLALVTVVPSSSSPLVALLLALQLFFSASGPLWLVPPALALLYAVWSRLRSGRRRPSAASSSPAATHPAEAP